MRNHIIGLSLNLSVLILILAGCGDSSTSNSISNPNQLYNVTVNESDVSSFQTMLASGESFQGFGNIDASAETSSVTVKAFGDLTPQSITLGAVGQNVSSNKDGLNISAQYIEKSDTKIVIDLNATLDASKVPSHASSGTLSFGARITFTRQNDTWIENFEGTANADYVSAKGAKIKYAVRITAAAGKEKDPSTWITNDFKNEYVLYQQKIKGLAPDSKEAVQAFVNLVNSLAVSDMFSRIPVMISGTISIDSLSMDATKLYKMSIVLALSLISQGS